MFIKTKDYRLINSDRVSYFEFLPYLNADKADIVAYIDSKCFTIFSGDASEAKYAFYLITDDLADNKKKIFDFDSYFNKELDYD